MRSLIEPALGGIVRALSDRCQQTDAERIGRAEAALGLILSFRPRDVIEMTLSGQTVLFNELIADGARDALREVVDTARLRGRAGVVAMGRLVQGHLDRLERRGNQPYQVETVAPRQDARPVAAAPTAAAESPRQLPDPVPPAQREPEMAADVAATPDAVARIEAAPPVPGQMTGPDAPDTEEGETSWLDAPYEQWRIDTPADPPTPAHVGSPATARSARPASDLADRGVARSGVAEPAFAREPAGYQPVRTLVDAAAD